MLAGTSRGALLSGHVCMPPSLKLRWRVWPLCIFSSLLWTGLSGKWGWEGNLHWRAYNMLRNGIRGIQGPAVLPQPFQGWCHSPPTTLCIFLWVDLRWIWIQWTALETGIPAPHTMSPLCLSLSHHKAGTIPSKCPGLKHCCLCVCCLLFPFPQGLLLQALPLWDQFTWALACGTSYLV